MAEFGIMTLAQNVPLAIDFPSGQCLNIMVSETTAFALNESDYSTSSMMFNPTLPANILIKMTGDIPERIWFMTANAGGGIVNYWLT